MRSETLTPSRAAQMLQTKEEWTAADIQAVARALNMAPEMDAIAPVTRGNGGPLYSREDVERLLRKATLTRQV